MLFLKMILFFSILITTVAILTYFERKILAAVQLRVGPNVVGFRGVLQPFADGIKLLSKQILFPKGVNKVLFISVPIMTLLFSLFGWLFVPMYRIEPLLKSELSLIFILAFQTVTALCVCSAGLVSRSYFARLGSLRAVVQTISVEICMAICLITVGNFSRSFDICKIADNPKTFFPLLLTGAIYFCGCLAEVNRTPFDTLEAEQELVAGYHTEYSSILFGFFYISEYANILFSSVMISILFLGGWHMPLLPDSFFWLLLKTSSVSFFIFLTRATLPRYTFKQTMAIFWRKLIPCALVLLIIIEIFFG